MKRFTLIVTTLIFSTILGASGVNEGVLQPSYPPLESQNTFTIAMLASEDELYLNPAQATDTVSLLVLDGLFEGLFSLAPQTGEPIAALAKRFTTSQNGLHWTFYLDERGRFSNGEPITAQSIVDSWLWLLERSRDENDNTYLVSMLDCIEGVAAYRTGNGSKGAIGISVSDPLTIELTLQYPAPYLPALLGTLPFSAIHSSLRNSKETPPKIIASGPYVIERIDTQEVKLAKHPWYRDYKAVPSDYIRFQFMDHLSLIEAYLEEEIHWSLAYIPRELLHDKEDLRITPEYSTGFYYFSTNEGAYSDPRIRRALELLIPWEDIRKESKQIFPSPFLVPNQKRTAKTNSFQDNQSEALQLLTEAGYPYGAGLPQLHIAVHRGAQVIESAEKIADIWSKNLGITVVIDIVPLSMYSRYPNTSPYDFAFITWIGDFLDPFTFLHLFSGSSGYNLGQYHNKEYDSLLNLAMAATTKEERNRLIEEAEDYLLSESVVFPLYHGITTNIINSKKVTGWYDNILNIHPVKHLAFE